MVIVLLNPKLIFSFVSVHLFFHLKLVTREGCFYLVKHLVHGLELQLHQFFVNIVLFQDLRASSTLDPLNFARNDLLLILSQSYILLFQSSYLTIQILNLFGLIRVFIL